MNALVGLGSRVKKCRKKLGISTLELDYRAGLCRGHVSKIESGERISPGIRTIASLAIALGVSIGWLATGKK